MLERRSQLRANTLSCNSMHVQQGLEGPPDLCPLTRSFLWMRQTHKRTRKHTKTHKLGHMDLSVFPHGRESRRACVSDVFPSESLWVPYRGSSFSVTLHVAAPSPRAAFSICKSNLLFVLWFCRQCSSILFPAPFISAYCCSPSPTHLYAPSPAFLHGR